MDGWSDGIKMKKIATVLWHTGTRREQQISAHRIRRCTQHTQTTCNNIKSDANTSRAKAGWRCKLGEREKKRMESEKRNNKRRRDRFEAINSLISYIILMYRLPAEAKCHYCILFAFVSCIYSNSYTFCVYVCIGWQ